MEQTSIKTTASIEQIYARVAEMDAPVLIHVDGRVEWGNRSFIQRFSINADMLPQVKIRELLWCLGIPEAVAGMIGEGVCFRHCEIPAADHIDGTLYLKQICLTKQDDGCQRMMLMMANEFDVEPSDFDIRAN
jgi:hypothetical protein